MRRHGAGGTTASTKRSGTPVVLQRSTHRPPPSPGASAKTPPPGTGAVMWYSGIRHHPANRAGGRRAAHGAPRHGRGAVMNSTSFAGVMERVRTTLLHSREYLTDAEMLALTWFILRADWRSGGNSFPGWRELAEISGLRGSDSSRERSAKRIRAALVRSGVIVASGTRIVPKGRGSGQRVLVYSIPSIAGPRGVTESGPGGDAPHRRGVTPFGHSKSSSEEILGMSPRKPPSRGATDYSAPLV